MNYVAPIVPTLIRRDWQRLVLLQVRGQKLRTRSLSFPRTTASLIAAVEKMRAG